jgi:hypothetical protein
MSNDNEKALQYAWNWFAFHADQRLKAFNFFLVLIGIVIVALTTCVGNAVKVTEQVGMINLWWGIATIVSAYGAIVSLSFWFLDIRNTELVECGRKALDELEKKLQLTPPSPFRLTIRKDDNQRTYLNKSLDSLSRIFLYVNHEPGKEKIPEKILKYKFVFRTIMIIAAFLFLLAFIFSLYKTLAPLTPRTPGGLFIPVIQI